MKMTKPMLVAAAVATIGVSGALVPGLVSADASTTSGTGNIVDMLAQKFNLKKEDVQAVFDEDKAAHQAEMQKKMSDRLQKAVDDGKLTAEQKTLIENKQKELQAARETEHKELQTWADQNKVNLKYLMVGHKRGGDSSSPLDQAVKDGNITAEQKTLIENKQKELLQKHEDAREALEKWADENNIDKKYLMVGLKGPGQKMMVRHF